MKNNVFIKNKNRELLENLKQTMEKNTICIDWVYEQKQKMEDMLKYNENDEDIKYSYEQLSYVLFVLYYLDSQYMKTFKQSGGKL